MDLKTKVDQIEYLRSACLPFRLFKVIDLSSWHIPFRVVLVVASWGRVTVTLIQLKFKLKTNSQSVVSHDRSFQKYA